MRKIFLLPVSLVLAAVAAWAADSIVVADWSQYPLGTRGIPEGWKGGDWGSPKYDFAIAEVDGQRVLHLKSEGDSSTIGRDIKGKVNLKQTPILEWRWKVTKLPRGADARKSATDDEAGQIYVTWPRFPEAVRSRIIGYIWDTTAPVGSIFKSDKTGTVTYVVVESGSAKLGQWITEHRNVVEDFKKIHGAEPENPGAVSISIDSDDTRSSAEAFVGPVLFRRP
ncbi:MAG TPA: DUF3047 domain-containing protein [Candidatus Acidoferrum sp.]|nr:DUF3047 domain-containing protein [Candidatus Acidoferrum sp.]